MSIVPHGRFLPVDADGYLSRDTDAGHIPELWWPLIRGVIAAYETNCGADLHSVYLRGSVPRGLAISAVSDLDTLAVCSSSLTREEPGWVDEVSQALHHEHRVGTGIEMTVVGMNHVLDPALAIGRILATQALCVHGPDLIDVVPRCRPDRTMICHALDLDGDIDPIPGWLVDPEEDNAEVCRWIMKRLVRAGLEMHIDTVGQYTRDLWPCYSVFAQHSPERAGDMHRALELAVYPTDDPGDLMAFLEDFGRWLAREAAASLASNPPTATR